MPNLTPFNVESLVRSGENRIATLYLIKSYDRVNRSIRLRDYEHDFDKETTKMLTSCLQALTVSTKGDIFGKQTDIRIGLTQSAQ